MANLGLIGGLGPIATIHYYRELAKAQAGEMLIVHANMEHALEFVRRDDRVGLAEYFAGSANCRIEQVSGGFTLPRTGGGVRPRAGRNTVIPPTCAPTQAGIALCIDLGTQTSL